MKLIGFIQDGTIYAKVRADGYCMCSGCAFAKDLLGCVKAPDTCVMADIIYKEVLVNENE